MKANRRFWLDLLIAPVDMLDLVDSNGKPDHGKILPAITLFWLLILASIGKIPSVAHTIVIVSCSFGYAGWRTFLRTRVPRLPAPKVEPQEEETHGA